jgi:flagellar basal body-associated protein FliL
VHRARKGSNPRTIIIIIVVVVVIIIIIIIIIIKVWTNLFFTPSGAQTFPHDVLTGSEGRPAS